MSNPMMETLSWDMSVHGEKFIPMGEWVLPMPTRVSFFRLSDWGACSRCGGMTRSKRSNGPRLHMLCHLAGRDAAAFPLRTGPNRHDHKRAGTVPDRVNKRPWHAQPAPFTPEDIAEFKAEVLRLGRTLASFNP